MNTPTLGTLALATSALLFAAGAQASTTVFDTGTPSGGLINSLSIDASDWAAESFTLSAKTTIDSILTYVKSTAVDEGLSFTVALYGSRSQGGSLVPSTNFFAGNQGQLQQFTATYTGNGGWIGQSGLNWTLDAGTYFVAIETDGSGVQGLVLPTGVSQLPSALAYYSGGSGYDADSSVSTDAFGLQVTAAAAVPEPATFALTLLGLGLVGAFVRRRGNKA